MILTGLLPHQASPAAQKFSNPQLTAKGEPRQQTYRFLNMEEAEWETFKSGRGVYASTNNFVGWKAGAPHTILIISGKGKSEANPER